LASLCHRPPQFFLDSKDRQEVALVYLYESLSLWENGEVQDIHAVIRECREEIQEEETKRQQQQQQEEEEEERRRRKNGWQAFVGKIEDGVKKLFKR